MVHVHRLNPNGMLVLLGTMMYVVVGGPPVVVGGIAIALALGAYHRPRESGDDQGPMSLFGGTPSPVTVPRRVAPGPFLRAVPIVG